jgi:plasmid stabilization system protein ParE
MRDLYNFIRYDCQQPMAATRYIAGLQKIINKLACYPESFPRSPYNFMRRKYGTNVRHTRYKKTNVIYTVKGNTVYIWRVLRGGLHD